MPEPPRRLKLSQRITLAVVPAVVAAFLRLLGLTWRVEDRFAEGAMPGHRIVPPVIFAFWHGSLLPAAWRFRGLEIAILISQSFDGELIARTAERLGFTVVRGSSTRGGAAGLRGMAEAWKAGHRCAFTADGPKGPARVAKPGPVQLAELTGAAWVGAFSIEADRAWRLQSWDGMYLPKPFARIRFGWPEHAAADLASVQAALEDGDRRVEAHALPERRRS